MAKKSEPVKNRTLTDLIDQRVWLSARATLLVVALASALPTPLSVMWGREVHSDYQAFLWPVFVASAWASVMAWGQRRYAFAQSRRENQKQEAPARSLVIGLLFDTSFLTACLYLGGAAHNPFTLLYFIPITLATFLSGRSPAFVAVASVAGFGLLLAKTSYFSGHGVHQQHLLLHIKGMAVALAVAGGLLTFFMRQIGLRLAQQRERLVQMQTQLQSDRAVTALGALAAGAAHELGSPLGTVQILAEELAFLDQQERDEAQSVMLEQLARIKTILHSMLSSELSAEQILTSSPLPFSVWVSELENACEDQLNNAEVRVLTPKGRYSEKEVSVPIAPVAQMLRELLKNAQKSGDQNPVVCEVSLEEDELSMSIKDQGRGMSAEQMEQAKKPFVSFSEGRGLGLFLIDVQVRQLGGSFELSSQPATGTCATLRLPRYFEAKAKS